MVVDIPLLSACLAFAVIVLLAVRGILRRRGRGHLPPGPKLFPIIGNVLDFPRTNVGPAFHELSKKHGDIIYFNLLGQPMVVLGSIKTAFDLLEKKSANFSGRPSTIVMKLLGLDSLFILMQYGPQWRHHRRAFHQSFGVEKVTQYQPIQLNAARRLLSRLLTSPNNLVENINILVADTGMRTVYGIDIAAEDGDGELYRMVERLRAFADPVVLPGGYLLEMFPALRHLPSWLPGVGIKRTVIEGRAVIRSTFDRLHVMSTAATSEGLARDSMVTRLLEDAGAEESQTADAREMCQYVAASTYLAGSDTTHALMEAFFLAMAMYPEKQQLAQAELDAVVGPDRLPEFSDRDSLPYVRALITELMRWHVVTPMGLPHATTEDDEYEGYFIPAGTIVNTNAWALSKDPEEYPDPGVFKPERFIGDKPPRDPADYVFGFGRRVCPGRHFGAASLFIYCTSVLHAFDIMPPMDENGDPVVMEYRPKDDLVSHIDGYDYIIKPRSTKAESLVANLMF